MKKNNCVKILFVFVLLLTGSSCSEEFSNPSGFNIDTPPKENQVNNDNLTSNSSKRSVSYELIGDFSGKLDMTFLSSDSFTAPDQIIGVELPYETGYNIPLNTQAIGGFVNGLYGDAKPGETALLKMLLDGNLIETVIRTADENGKITLPLESYHLKYDKSGTKIAEENIGKEITYKIEGDFSGNLVLVYKIADGSQENIEVTQLPWQYTFQTTENSYRASIYGLGSSGVEGQEIAFSISADETTVQSEVAKTGNDGRIGLFPELFIDFN